MLVLSRKIGQTIRIGNTSVELLEIKGHRVRLGVSAPDDVRIVRTELAPRPSPCTTVPAPLQHEP